ncbi:MAG: nucleotidyltransferase family protein, partial [bacterium]
MKREGGISDNTPEFEFLCRAVGCALGYRRPSFPEAIPGMLNQSLLIQLAMRHRCLPLLAEGLARVRQEGQPSWVTFGPEMQARMNRALAVGAGRAVFLARRLVSLSGTFKDAGVRAMALKGPAMAQALYGHVDYRPSDDLDVWIHPGDFAKASGIMESLGFTPLVSLSTDEARAHMQAGWDRGYRSPAGDYVVELCTGMAPSYFARPPEVDVLWAGAQELTLEGGRVRTPGPEALLELLCLHGTKHGWSR